MKQIIQCSQYNSYWQEKVQICLMCAINFPTSKFLNMAEMSRDITHPGTANLAWSEATAKSQLATS